MLWYTVSLIDVLIKTNTRACVWTEIHTSYTSPNFVSNLWILGLHRQTDKQTNSFTSHFSQVISVCVFFFVLAPSCISDSLLSVAATDTPLSIDNISTPSPFSCFDGMSLFLLLFFNWTSFVALICCTEILTCYTTICCWIVHEWNFFLVVKLCWITTG